MNNSEENTLFTKTGTIEKIIFKNSDNDYVVASFRFEGSLETETIYGILFNINAGEHLEITAQYTNSPKYGRQIKVENYRTILPVNKEGIEKYLGSGLIRGIGPVMAKRITDKFGEDTINILDNSISRLSEIEGFAEKRIKLVRLEWRKQADLREIMIYLQSLGITPAYSRKIYNKYGKNSINVIKDNPYRLSEDIFGIGFKIADRIAQNTGIEKDSIFRIKAGIKYILQQLEEKGNCYTPQEIIIQHANSFLETEIAAIENSLNELFRENEIVIEDEKVYLKKTFEDEYFVAEKLVEIKNQSIRCIIKKENFKEKINCLTGNKIDIDEDQENAIRDALNENIMVITGSPGTGKSTILDYILKLFESENSKVMLAAPTGRAAKRLSETTGKEAKTIHRLLEYNPKSQTFARNGKNKLSCDILIIDEASMIDIKLMRSLVEAFPLQARLIFVGDVDQLPSVGPGCVLSDIINSGSFKVARLTKIYRQFGKSKIIQNAHRIRDGLYPDLYEKDSDDYVKDFYFIEKDNQEDTVKTILKAAYYNIPEKFGFDPLKDIQILVPVNKGMAGVENINKMIQEKFNKNTAKIISSGREFKLGDKVIQIKNNYEKDVYNGDIGFIKFIDFELQEFKIDFGYKTVDYNFYEIDEIALSYAISIHKSQGSEFKCTIIPVLTSYYMLLQRNLLYTAVTRARELAVIVGSKKAIGMAVSKSNVEKRYTNLRFLLSD